MLIKNFFLKIRNLKIKKPPKIDVVVLDDGFSNIKFDKNIKYFLLDKEIYFFILMKSLLQFFFVKKKNANNLSDFYFINLINSLNPKIAFGHEYNGKLFRFKNLFPEKISIIYQLPNQAYFLKKTAPAMIKNKRKDLILKSDYFLTKFDWCKNFYDFVDTKFIEVGSVKNNEIPVKNFDKKYDIMFVSQFRIPVTSYWGTNDNVASMRTVDSATSYLIKILNKYCEEKSKKICIALSAYRKDKKKNKFTKHGINMNDEIDFYSRDIKNFYHEDISSYELAEKSEMVITTNSTLGFDLLARNKKTLFIDINYFLGSYLDPIINSKEGFFWYQGQEPDVIKRKIDSMLQINNDDWIKLLNESKLKMKLDPNNSILKNLVSKLLKN